MKNEEGKHENINGSVMQKMRRIVLEKLKKTDRNDSSDMCAYFTLLWVGDNKAI